MTTIPQWLLEQEFSDLCSNYRSWPGSDPEGVIDRFEELQKYIAEHVGKE